MSGPTRRHEGEPSPLPPPFSRLFRRNRQRALMELDDLVVNEIDTLGDAEKAINFSYAAPTDPRLRRMTIRGIERLTGQPRLKRLYYSYVNSPQPREDFFEAAIQLLRLQVDFDRRRLEQIPQDGPLIVVANHPFGVVDGLAISYLISRVRQDYKVVAHGLLTRAPEAAERIIPIDFSGTSEAVKTNLETRRETLNWLKSGHVLVIFPAGEVSTAPKPFERAAVDARWKPFTARLIHATKAPVLPVFFSGQNSRLFQVASHVSPMLRTSLLFNEVSNKIGATVHLSIGTRLAYERLAHIKDRQELVDYLCRLTYALAPRRSRFARPGRHRRLVA